MRIAFFCSLPIMLVPLVLEAIAKGTCPNSAGNSRGPYAEPIGQPSDALLSGFGEAQARGPLSERPRTNAPFPAVLPTHGGPTAAQAVPAAQITILNTDSAVTSIAPEAPKATLMIVDDVTPVAGVLTQPQIAKASEPEKPAETVTPETIDGALADLVGKWKAVARHRDGTLTTVELQLDNRGWAELTVPDSNGDPSTTKSRVKFKDQELKLESGDNVTLLGRLLTFNKRQLVLERAEGKVTFVRI